MENCRSLMNQRPKTDVENDSRNIRKRSKNILHLVFILLLKNAWLLVFIVCIIGLFHYRFTSFLTQKHAW